MEKGVSIIIPSYNEEDGIEDCIKSLLAIDYDPYEIIIVDGCSTDNTQNIINKYIKMHENIKLIRNPKKFTASNRNEGIKAANYDYIAFTDADCTVPTDWLKILMLEFKPDISGVGGANIAPRSADPFVQAISKAQSTFLGNLGSVQGKIVKKTQFVPSLATCNSIYRKSALESVGLFSENQKDLGEDWELNHKLTKKGLKLLIVKDSFVLHKFRATPRKFFSNMYRYGMGRAILNKKYPNEIKIVYLLPLLFLPLILTGIGFILYCLLVGFVSAAINHKNFINIWKVFFLQHFGYSLGEYAGLIFNDKYRL